jgi:hypothetical protein
VVASLAIPVLDWVVSWDGVDIQGANLDVVVDSCAPVVVVDDVVVSIDLETGGGEIEEREDSEESADELHDEVGASLKDLESKVVWSFEVGCVW